MMKTSKELAETMSASEANLLSTEREFQIPSFTKFVCVTNGIFRRLFVIRWNIGFTPVLETLRAVHVGIDIHKIL